MNKFLKRLPRFAHLQQAFVDVVGANGGMVRNDSLIRLALAIDPRPLASVAQRPLKEREPFINMPQRSFEVRLPLLLTSRQLEQRFLSLLLPVANRVTRFNIWGYFQKKTGHTIYLVEPGEDEEDELEDDQDEPRMSEPTPDEDEGETEPP